MSNNILIIKHGALGDLIQITNALKSIRHKYPESKITLLTDIKFKFFSDRIIFIDEIIYENRPSFLRIDEWLTIILKIARRNFNIVFDLQNSDRTSVYYFFIRLFNSKVIWSGKRKGVKYKYHPKNFESVPIKDRIKNQLALMNIEIYDNPDISWMLNKNIINLPNNDFVILLPGSSLEHKYKRWPAEKFAELANHLKERNIDSIILGQSHSEGEELKKIKLLAPKIIDFSNQDLDCLATTASKAIGAIGNDTGPTFIAAAAGCPITWLLSSHTDPNITQLLGSKVNTLKKDNISDITTDEVKNNLALRD